MNINQLQKYPQEQNNQQTTAMIKTAWPLLIYQVPTMLAHNFNTSFPLPCPFVWGKQWGESLENTQIAQFCRVKQVQCPRQTQGDWLPSESWQFYRYSNNKTYFMLFKTLWCVLLHIFTLVEIVTFTIWSSGLVRDLALSSFGPGTSWAW